MKNKLRRLGSLALALLLIFSLFAGCTKQDAVDIGFAIVETVIGGDSDSSAIGIIGGADGPTSIIVGEIEDDEPAPPAESSEPVTETEPPAENPEPDIPDEDGWYDTVEAVAEYIHIYGHLPDNFITKNEARDLGWESSEGNLWDVAYGMSIGGDKFGNREGLLPDAKGRVWYECDINYQGGFRGSERIVFSNDGLIYYTADHYESFEKLY